MTDDELMKAIAQRDSAAYSTLANRHVDRLYRYALRLAGDGATAEDLVQDAWVTVWEKPQSYKPGKVNSARNHQMRQSLDMSKSGRTNSLQNIAIDKNLKMT